jgi:tight adherence protein B
MTSARAVIALAFAALAVTSQATASIDEVRVDTNAYPRIRLSIVTSAPSVAPPRVAAHGSRVAGVRATNLGTGTGIVLAIDRSQSMAGRPLGAAVDAARLFLARKSASQRVALVAFGSQAVQLTSFETSTSAARRALAGLAVDGRPGTALYGALRLSSELLEDLDDAGRVVVLLTDGSDRLGGVSLEQALASVRRAGVVVYTVGIEGSGFARGPLRRMAGTSGGRYLSADRTELAGAFGALSTALRRTWRLEFLTAGRPGERLRLQVWVPGLGERALAVELPRQREQAGSGGSALAGSVAGDVLLALVVGSLVLAAHRALAAWRRARWLRGRVGSDGARDQSAPRRSLRDRGRESAAGLLGATERVAGDLAAWKSLERRLQRARVPLRASELLYVMLGCGLAFGLLVAVFGPPSAVIVLAVVAGALGPLAVVSLRGRRRRRAFEDQLPDVLMTLAGALKAGQSFRQGIQTIVEEGTEPAVGEFRLVLNEARLGRPLEDALAEMADRLESKDFSFVVSAVTIQRQVGGSLAGIFDLVATAVRQRQQFARRIKALTATGRMSAYVLMALPIGLAAALTAMNPEYMAPMYTTGLGHAMIASGLVMMGIGGVVLRRIVSFKG